jgi:hypothetical protein
MTDNLLLVFLAIVWLHFFGDFILQTDKQAINKSSNSVILTEHVAFYSLPFLVFGAKFAVVNGVLHFITDYFTSRATKKLWEKNERHWFFVVIGLDQAIHFTCLFSTYVWLVQ